MANSSLRQTTRVAGLTYILIILIGVIKVNLIEPSIFSAESQDPVASILANGLLFRVGIASEIIMYLLVIVLSLALYSILKPIDKFLALSALFFRFGEAILGGTVTIVSGLVPWLLVNSEAAVEPGPMLLLVESFLDLRVAGLNIILTFVGIGGTIFCYLFYRSRIVPRSLAAWGIFTYLSMLLLGLLNVLLPGRLAMIEAVLFGLGAFFELLFGFWLLLGGVVTEKWITYAER